MTSCHDEIKYILLCILYFIWESLDDQLQIIILTLVDIKGHGESGKGHIKVTFWAGWSHVVSSCRRWDTVIASHCKADNSLHQLAVDMALIYINSKYINLQLTSLKLMYELLVVRPGTILPFTMLTQQHQNQRLLLLQTHFDNIPSGQLEQALPHARYSISTQDSSWES